MLPVSSMLEAYLSLLPHAPVGRQVGRPKKGPRARKTKKSNIEYHSSSKYNMPMSAAYGPVAVSSDTRHTAGAASGSSWSNVIILH